MVNFKHKSLFDLSLSIQNDKLHLVGRVIQQQNFQTTNQVVDVLLDIWMAAHLIDSKGGTMKRHL